MNFSAKLVMLFALAAVVSSVPVDYAAYDDDDLLPVVERAEVNLEDEVGDYDGDDSLSVTEREAVNIEDDLDALERGLEGPPEEEELEDADPEWLESLNRMVNDDIDEEKPLVREEKKDEKAAPQSAAAHQHPDVEIKMP